jgi:glutamate 5-kinase
MAAQHLRIVLKFGSGILARADGTALDLPQFKRLTAAVAGLSKAGHECIVVSSGAVAAGLSVLGLKERSSDTPTIQACAAIGQSRLMRQYETHFHRYDLAVAQLLLTHQDIDSRIRLKNAKATLNRLIAAKNIIPIINENDSVAVEELRVGDNDRLSAEVAILAEADLLILLTSVDGLSKNGPGGEVIPLVKNVDSVMALATDDKGRFSVGGMVTKLQAVKTAVEAGITTVIANGRKGELIEKIVKGELIGTRFVAKRRRL